MDIINHLEAFRDELLEIEADEESGVNNESELIAKIDELVVLISEYENTLAVDK